MGVIIQNSGLCVRAAMPGGQQAAPMMAGVIGPEAQLATLPVGTPSSVIHSAALPQPQGILGYPPLQQQQGILGPSVAGQRPQGMMGAVPHGTNVGL